MLWYVYLFQDINKFQASIFGKSFGKIKWPSSNKTIEGTLGAFISVLLFAYLISIFQGQTINIEVFTFILIDFINHFSSLLLLCWLALWRLLQIK